MIPRQLLLPFSSRPLITVLYRRTPDSIPTVLLPTPSLKAPYLTQALKRFLHQGTNLTKAIGE